jgi:hypothetical protein
MLQAIEPCTDLGVGMVRQGQDEELDGGRDDGEIIVEGVRRC